MANKIVDFYYKNESFNKICQGIGYPGYFIGKKIAENSNDSTLFGKTTHFIGDAMKHHPIISTIALGTLIALPTAATAATVLSCIPITAAIGLTALKVTLISSLIFLMLLTKGLIAYKAKTSIFDERIGGGYKLNVHHNSL